MSTSEVAIPLTLAFRTRGCVLTEQASEPSSPRHDERLRQTIETEIRQRFDRQREDLQSRQQQRWARLETELERTLRAMEVDIKRQLIEMSVRIAEIILRRALPDGDMVRGVLDDILEPISDLQGVRVRMAPGDVELLRAGNGQPARSTYLEWVEAPELKPGDIQVESRNGFFDGRLHERLATLAEALAATHGHAGDAHEACL